MAVNLVLTFITYLVSLILLPFLALIFVRIYRTDWRLFFVVAALQGVIALALLMPVLAGFPTAGAIILPGVLAAAAGIFSIIGLVLYALLFFLVYRPKNWKRNSQWIAGASALALIALFGPSLMARSGITTNVDLHGIVTDIDGRPIPNAEVHSRNCPYVKDPMPVTDADGRFRLIANCRGLLIIDRIRNRETMTYCQSWYPSSSQHGLMVFNSHGGLDDVRGPGYANYPAENPVIIPCVWHVPDTVWHYQGTDHEFPVDGRRITFAPEVGGRYLEVVDDERNGVLSIEFVPAAEGSTDTSVPIAGRLRISAVSGGIQVTGDYEPFNAAPADGYQPYAELALEDGAWKADGNYYFHAHDRRVYGSLRVWMSLSFDYEAKIHKLPLQVRLDSYMNHAGSRVLLTHKVPYR